MEAKDLMIGDWVKLEDVRLGNINFVGPVVQIKSITGRHVLIPNSKGLLEDVTEEHLLPIPFTYEILEKNGFKPLEEDSYVCKELSDIDDYIIVVDLLVLTCHTLKSTRHQSHAIAERLNMSISSSTFSDCVE